MTEKLRPLSLFELRMHAEGRHWRVHQPIAGLTSLTPVQGELQAVHHGAALEIHSRVETIVTLCCDRCLQHFNQPLRAELSELVELRSATAAAAASGEPLELWLEAGGEDLDDRLDPAGVFDPEQWLFEQLSLRLPLVNRCGADCPGPACWSSDPQGGDPRWAALAQLQPVLGADAAALPPS